MSDFLDLQGAKDLNTDAIHIGAVANSVDPATGAPIDAHVNRVGGTDYTLHGFWNALGPVVMPWTSATGGTLTQPNQAFLHPDNGSYYSWTGAYPVGGYVVSPGTDPTTVTGYVPRTDAGLLDRLSADDGASLVKLKPAGVTGAIKRALDEVIYDQIIDVKWFGAVGDWDMGAQTGSDDTAAIQAALTHFATLGSRRVGAKRALKFPMGHYRYSALTIPAGIGFGLDIIGDGENSTCLWVDHTNASPAFTCEIESFQFRNIMFAGSLSDSVAGNPTLWKDIGFKCRNSYSIPDIDVSFKNCTFLFFKDVCHAYGRGVTFTNCAIGEINCMLNIVCDPSISFVSGDALRSVETGMRIYDIRNNRTDQVRESLIKISGTGPQKEYINGISIRNNDFVGTVKLINAPDATLRRLSVSDNTGLYSFRFGVIAAKGVTSADIISNNFSRRFEETIEPSGFNDAIQGIIGTSAELRNCNIIGNTVRNLSASPVATAGSASNITITQNNFPNGWTYFESANNLCHIFYAPINCPGLRIDGNQFTSTVTSRTYRAFNPATQTDKNTFIGCNPAPWSWVDSRLGYTPDLLVNGTASATAPSGSSGRYYYDGKYVHVDVMMVINPSETSGNLSISLPPVLAVAENLGMTGTYSGGGLVNKATGFASAGNAFAPIQVNPVTQEAELWKEGGMVKSRVTAADKSGVIVIAASFKYRH